MCHIEEEGVYIKVFMDSETLRKSKVGIGSDYIRRDTATRFARPLDRE